MGSFKISTTLIHSIFIIQPSSPKPWKTYKYLKQIKCNAEVLYHKSFRINWLFIFSMEWSYLQPKLSYLYLLYKWGTHAFTRTNEFSFDAGLNVLDLLVTPVGYYIIRDKRLTLKGLRGVSKNVSFRARVRHWFLMTFNIIINDIFPENFIEIP